MRYRLGGVVIVNQTRRSGYLRDWEGGIVSGADKIGKVIGRIRRSFFLWGVRKRRVYRKREILDSLILWCLIRRERSLPMPSIHLVLQLSLPGCFSYICTLSAYIPSFDFSVINFTDDRSIGFRSGYYSFVCNWADLRFRGEKNDRKRGCYLIVILNRCEKKR